MCEMTSGILWGVKCRGNSTVHSQFDILVPLMSTIDLPNVT